MNGHDFSNYCVPNSIFKKHDGVLASLPEILYVVLLGVGKLLTSQLFALLPYIVNWLNIYTFLIIIM